LAIVSIKDLLEAGVHYGHRTSRWNPKMERYIFGKRNSIHIIDLRETIRGLIRGAKFLRSVASRGEWVLWVGTKRQAATVVEKEATRLGMPWVTYRWLGGALTNFRTVRERLGRLEELEEMERSGRMALLGKKMVSMLRREERKIFRNLHGIRLMDRLPGALVVFDPQIERNAVHEANILDIPVVSLLDTDADPDLVDIVIPGNDDAVRSIELVVQVLGKAVEEGKMLAREGVQAATEGSDNGDPPVTPEVDPGEPAGVESQGQELQQEAPPQ